MDEYKMRLEALWVAANCMGGKEALHYAKEYYDFLSGKSDKPVSRPVTSKRKAK
jgi:hypothetical protein